MDSKQLWLTIIVSLIVAAVTAIVTVNVTGNTPAFSPDLGGGDSFVRAHSCDADGTCEANSLDVDGDALVGSAVWTRGMVQIGGELNTPQGVIQAVNQPSGIQILSNGDRGIEMFAVNGKLAFYTDPFSTMMELTGEKMYLTSENYTGQGIGYLCIDEAGLVLRSQIPCV